MQSFYDLYNQLVQASMKGELQKKVEAGIPDLDEHHLDCLLNHRNMRQCGVWMIVPVPMRRKKRVRAVVYLTPSTGTNRGIWQSTLIDAWDVPSVLISVRPKS